MPLNAWIRILGVSLLAAADVTVAAAPNVPHATTADVSLHRIDATVFEASQAKSTGKPKPLRRIEDQAEVEKLLAGRVRFVSEAGPEQGVLSSITLPDGHTLTPDDTFYFIAYFPDEDILLLRGGHESDQAYDLRTGGDITLTGNPDYILNSPDGAYRLNGYFPGQECSEYFLQQRKDGRYVPVVSINELFASRIDDRWGLCTMLSSHWSDARTLNFYRVNYRHDAESGTKEYFQLRIAAP